jgi:hypothetical protein
MTSATPEELAQEWEDTQIERLAILLMSGREFIDASYTRAKHLAEWMRDEALRVGWDLRVIVPDLDDQ